MPCARSSAADLKNGSRHRLDVGTSGYVGETSAHRGRHEKHWRVFFVLTFSSLFIIRCLFIRLEPTDRGRELGSRLVWSLHLKQPSKLIGHGGADVTPAGSVDSWLYRHLSRASFQASGCMSQLALFFRHGSWSQSSTGRLILPPPRLRSNDPNAS